MDPKCLLTSTDLQTRRACCQHRLSFLFSESTIITLIAFTKCSPYSRMNWHITYHTVLQNVWWWEKFIVFFTKLCIHPEPICTNNNLFILFVCSYSPFELWPLTSNPTMAPTVAAKGNLFFNVFLAYPWVHQFINCRWELYECRPIHPVYLTTRLTYLAAVLQDVSKSYVVFLLLCTIV